MYRLLIHFFILLSTVSMQSASLVCGDVSVSFSKTSLSREKFENKFPLGAVQIKLNKLLTLQ